MDTSTFILERHKQRERMDAKRAELLPGSNGEKPSWWRTALSLAMSLGLFPLIENAALEGIRRWVSDKARRMHFKL